MKRLFYLIALVALTSLRVSAENIVNVSGEATFYDDGSHSRRECIHLVTEQARIDALARKFGTIVSQDILQSDRIKGNREQSDFLALSSTEVKGEWISDDCDPSYEFDFDKDHNLIVTCRIKGKAREISNHSVPFEAVVLRNGTDTKNADNLFRDGDDLYLRFRGAADGYLAVFLEDEDDNVFLLLPYPKYAGSRVPVKRDKEYVFFSRDLDPRGELTGAEAEEIFLTAPRDPEYNRMYVLFSPEPFSRPTMNSGEGLAYMNSKEFNNWLLKTRKNDSKMGVKAINLRISPK